MRKVTSIASAALAVTLLAAPVYAATVDVSPVNSKSVFADRNGQNKWYVGTSFMVGNKAVNNVAAGAFRVEGKVTGPDEHGFMRDFLAFCLQPLERLTLPKTHTVNNPFSATVSSDLQALASNAWGRVTNSKTAGAFQLAVWEIVTESGAYNIQSGDFKVTSNRGDSNAAEALAQTWLNNISSADWTASGNGFQILTASGTQDLLTNVESPSPVPLPATGWMLIASLAGAGYAAKRKKA